VNISTLPSLDAALQLDPPVAIGVSGGKDSQAAALATIHHLNQLGHKGPRILVHSDLGVVEWNDSLPICRELAAHLGLELLIVRRQAGDLMDRWEGRWQSSIRRYSELSTVTLVPCWSTPSMRFCTSELKTHVIQAALKKRYGKQTVVNVTGVRRAESAARAKSTIADFTPQFINWRPIADWSEQEVFAAIDQSGLRPHPAYREFKMSRVSCRFCIMSNISDMQAAAIQPESHDLYHRMVQLEVDSTFGFQGSRWLADVAPQLVQHLAVDAAKSRARARVELEKRITKAMLYVKGWPTRMLTDDEADILAGVRTEMSELFGFNAQHLTRESIHARYAELTSEKERRLAA
jgi:3'-phosphoadenosine 5'-phosphosulfate sulfotransferase (PAPS reductase)/FAD synthetase